MFLTFRSHFFTFRSHVLTLVACSAPVFACGCLVFLRPLLAQHPSSEILERHPFLHQCAWSLGAGATDLFLLQFFESSWCSVWHWSSSLIMYDRRFERLKRFDLDSRWGSWSVQLLWLKPSPRSHLSFKRWVLWKFMDQIELNWFGFCSLSPWWQLRQIRTDKAPEKVIKSLAGIRQHRNLWGCITSMHVPWIQLVTMDATFSLKAWSCFGCLSCLLVGLQLSWDGWRAPWRRPTRRLVRESDHPRESRISCLVCTSFWFQWSSK